MSSFSYLKYNTLRGYSERWWEDTEVHSPADSACGCAMGNSSEHLIQTQQKRNCISVYLLLARNPSLKHSKKFSLAPHWLSHTFIHWQVEWDHHNWLKAILIISWSWACTQLFWSTWFSESWFWLKTRSLYRGKGNGFG